jgi:ribosome-associated translation inhibitor RaiA
MAFAFLSQWKRVCLSHLINSNHAEICTAARELLHRKALKSKMDQVILGSRAANLTLSAPDTDLRSLIPLVRRNLEVKMPAVQTHAYETDRELKAYIYQQLVDIQPFLVADSQVAVMVHQVPAEQDETLKNSDQTPPQKKSKKAARAQDFVVTLIATTEDGRLESEGQALDIYEAFSKAKNQMQIQLEEWQNAQMDPLDREVAIQSVLNGSQLIH